MTGSTVEVIKTALSKYNSYDADWEKAYFDTQSGGYNVYHKSHNFAKKGGGGDAEKIVGKMLAYLGKHVEFLPENLGKKAPDLQFDNQTWDIKFIDNASEHTIRDCVRNARKADSVIFYFTNDKHDILNRAVEREVGRLKKNGFIEKLPDIYYVDTNRYLTLLWKK